MDISKAIREIREEKRLTQLEVAEMLQMERSNYARLEARGNKLTVEQLENIARVLGVSVVELLTGEPNSTSEDTVKELDTTKKELEFYKQLYRKTDTLYENLIDTVIRKLSLLDMHYSPEAVNSRIKILERLTEEKVIDEQEIKILMDSANAFSSFIDPDKWGLPKERKIGRQFVTEEEFRKDLHLGGFLDSLLIRKAYELGRRNANEEPE